MDGNLIQRGPPGEFSAFAFGVASLRVAGGGGGVRRELLTVEFDYDSLSLKAFRDLLPHVLERFDLMELDHAWVSWSFPDHLGSVIAWAVADGVGGYLLEYGLGGKSSFREILEAEPERLSDLTDVIVSDVNNQLCLRHFGRVFSIRERWAELVAEYLLEGQRGARMEEVAPGYYICVRRKRDAAPVESLAPKSIRLSSFVLPGGAAALEDGRRRPGLLHRRGPTSPLGKFLAEEMDLTLEIFLNPQTLISEWTRVAGEAGLRLRPEGGGESGELRVELTNELGLSMAFDAKDVLRSAADQARSLGEQAALQGLVKARILTAQVAFVRELERVLPEGFEPESPSSDGRLRIRHADGEARIIDLWTLPLEFDLEEDDSRRRFLSFLRGADPGPLEQPLQEGIAKELHSARWLREHLAQARAGSGRALLYRLRATLVDVFSEGAGDPSALAACREDIDEAERRWRAHLPRSRWQAQGQMVRIGRLIEHRALVLAGPGIANVVLHAALVRGLCDAAGFGVGRRVHVFAPRSGLLVVATGDVPTGPLRQVAYRFFIDHARDRLSHLMGDTLHFRARMRLPPPGQGIGHFTLRPLESPWILDPGK